MSRARRPATTALALALAIASGTGTARVARADATATASESARALFNEGLALRARGDLAGAIAKLRAAYALRPTAVIAFELGRAYAEHGDLVEGRDLLVSVKRLPATAGESKDAQAARRDAAALAEDLKVRIPSLTVTLGGPGASAATTLIIDGEEIPREAAREPLRLNPRAHHVVARAEGGREVAADVSLHEGEQAHVVLDVPAPPPPPPAQIAARSASPAAVPAPRVDAPSATAPKILAYGGFGVALVGAAIGTFAGVRAVDQVSALKSVCNEHRICGPDEADAIEGAKTTGNVATMAFVGAGVGAALGVLGLVLWPRGEAAADRPAAITVSPSTLGVRGSF